MKKNQKLPDEDHIVRHVSPSRLQKDEDLNVVGILPQAFELREKEPYLSSTWLEYFAGDRDTQLTATVRAFRHSLDIKKSSGFAVGNVGEIVKECTDRNHTTRIVYEPVDTNKAHCAVKRFPRDDFELPGILANGAWSELHLNSSFPDGSAAAPDLPVGRSAKKA